VEKEVNNDKVCEQFREDPLAVSRGYSAIRPKESRVQASNYTKKECRKNILRITDEVTITSKYEKASIMLLSHRFIEDANKEDKRQRGEVLKQFVVDLEAQRERKRKREKEIAMQNKKRVDHQDGSWALIMALATEIVCGTFVNFDTTIFKESAYHIKKVLEEATGKDAGSLKVREALEEESTRYQVKRVIEVVAGIINNRVMEEERHVLKWFLIRWLTEDAAGTPGHLFHSVNDRVVTAYHKHQHIKPENNTDGKHPEMDVTIREARETLQGQTTKSLGGDGTIEKGKNKEILCTRLAREFTAITKEDLATTEGAETKEMYQWLIKGDEWTPGSVVELVKKTTRTVRSKYTMSLMFPNDLAGIVRL
jgi:hypothetical protein